jgi:hypothetical protein
MTGREPLRQNRSKHSSRPRLPAQSQNSVCDRRPFVLTPRMAKFPTGRRWFAFIVIAAIGLTAFWGAGRSPRGWDRNSAFSSQRPDADRRARRVSASAEIPPANLAVNAGAPAAAVRPLFSYVRPANATALDAALPAPTRELHYVRIDRALIAGKSSPFWQPAGEGRLTLPLADGRALEILIDHSEMLDAGRFTSVGHVSGRPASRAIFAVTGGFLHASVSDAELGTFALRVATAELSQFYQIDPALLGPCGGAITPVIDADVRAPSARQLVLANTTVDAGAAPPVAAAENAQRPEVHVMMVYTPAVLTTLSGAERTAALQSAFDAALAKMNDSLALSQVTARVKLVKIFESPYAADGSGGNLVSGLQQTALAALSGTTDGQLDDVHAARDAAGADVVMLALNRRDVSSIGLSYVLNNPSSTREAVAANFNPQFAFSVIEYGSIAGSNVVSHELGHIFGNAHAHGDAGATGTRDGAFTYSYGYRVSFTSNGASREYHDIMAYFPGTELSYFSNPRLTPPELGGRAFGVIEGQVGAADAARTIDQTAFEVATFRLQTQSAVNPGTMVNVSTRAFVGTGDQVLIGGFVLNGAKKVIIRAAGPALLNYGVTNALADPVLRIFSGSTQIAANDDWGAQLSGANASDTLAGGLAFASGSKDAAIALTLAAGAYTAIVEGKNASTGSGLVEVYDTDAGPAKLINLSTRGYVDRNGKEMFGGFVVQGAAGTTKRVLIRVLGPTLSRLSPPIVGVLDDPILELHNAAGDLLLQNDDWSMDAQGGASDVNDFTPVVTTYSEKRVAATGFAPTNRREPAIMVDLPPGSYTVIVKPFELHDPVLNVDQVAKPGTAIIEVYEINP